VNSITTAGLAAIVNLVVLVVIPLGTYALWHKLRHKRNLAEIAHRAGLCTGNRKYLGYAAGLSAIIAGIVVAVHLFQGPSDGEGLLTREGSAMAQFAGLGLSSESIILALIYGVIKTGFAEELLFRGLIAGSLGRRLPLLWANVIQSIIFLLPHLLLLLIVPELWWLLIVTFFTALVKGWLRIKSDSIIGPWMMHATANVSIAISVAVRAVG
jgi:membrane protease YdiL (CAAX protease family)